MSLGLHQRSGLSKPPRTLPEPWHLGCGFWGKGLRFRTDRRAWILVCDANFSTPLDATQTLTWTIGKIPKDKSPCLSGTMQLEKGVEQLHEFPTMLVGFKIMGVAMSGLRIDKTELQNVSYTPYKGFRAVSRAASYEIRT